MTTTKKLLIALAAIALFGLGMLTGPYSWDGEGYSRTTDQELKPCPTEDAPGPCYWDAKEQGNGQGVSFWVDSDQQVHYHDEELAHCEWLWDTAELPEEQAEAKRLCD